MKCKYEHDGDCCNSGADQYMCKCKKPCGFIWPLSNADHIRSMTDEEMAEFIRWDICSKIRGDNRMCNGWCDECVADWLKAPYKDGE